MFVLRVGDDGHWEATCEICGEEFMQNKDEGGNRRWRYGADFLQDLRSHYNWRQRPGKGCQWKKTFGATT